MGRVPAPLLINVKSLPNITVTAQNYVSSSRKALQILRLYRTMLLFWGLKHNGRHKMANDGTLTRADLAETLNNKVGLSRAESSRIIESLLCHMSDALADGENVKISGFGTFVLRDKNGRVGRNPKTGIEVPITPRRVLTFRPSQIMREQVAKG